MPASRMANALELDRDELQAAESVAAAVGVERRAARAEWIRAARAVDSIDLDTLCSASSRGGERYEAQVAEYAASRAQRRSARRRSQRATA